LTTLQITKHIFDNRQAHAQQNNVCNTEPQHLLINLNTN